MGFVVVVHLEDKELGCEVQVMVPQRGLEVLEKIADYNEIDLTVLDIREDGYIA